MQHRGQRAHLIAHGRGLFELSSAANACIFCSSSFINLALPSEQKTDAFDTSRA